MHCYPCIISDRLQGENASPLKIVIILISFPNFDIIFYLFISKQLIKVEAPPSILYVSGLNLDSISWQSLKWKIKKEWSNIRIKIIKI